MRVNSETPIGVVIATLRKEIEDRKTQLAMLEAITAQGVSPSAPFTNGSASGVHTGRPRRGGKKPSIAHASIEILRAAGRPLHGLRELLPQLEAQGIRVKHKAGLATILMRTDEVVRTSPGTFAVKGGTANPN